MACNKLDTERVFYYFNKLCSIPHGSGNMNGIADFCVEFAKQHNLEYKRDNADNVIIYKHTKNYPFDAVILQGHLDMVCQSDAGFNIDFLKDGIKPFIKDGFLTAEHTTLGADNGIAVAMILAILEDDRLVTPSIEAVFTTDEEIGMVGAKALDTSLLRAKRMINIDSEDENTLTVSCAGGSDFSVQIPTAYTTVTSTEITVILKGLKGGHSGIEIDKNRHNANILAGRFLNHMKNQCQFDIISLNGGDKSNAIPNCCTLKLCTNNPKNFETEAQKYLQLIKSEISAGEPDFSPEIVIGEEKELKTFSENTKNDIISVLLTCPNGIMGMSAEIENLVETSLNLGVLDTHEDGISLQFALRSNKQSALDFLEEKLYGFFERFNCKTTLGGKYPTWEFKENSDLRKLYCDTYFELTGRQVSVEAIHAGLECAVFSSAIRGLDCIAIGPTILGAHTTEERLSIPSTEKIFNVLLSLLKKLK